MFLKNIIRNLISPFLKKQLNAIKSKKRVMENNTKKGDHRDMICAVIDSNTLDSFLVGRGGGGLNRSQKSGTRGS
jgi:hypothetical protein